jgi:hypothetical protein
MVFGRIHGIKELSRPIKRHIYSLLWPLPRIKGPGRTLSLALSLLLPLGLLLFGPGELYSYLKSDYIGGFPGICEDGVCMDNGIPTSFPPPDIRRNILEHQLKSPVCPTDLIYITLEYPENTGSPELDAYLSTAMARKFKEARDRALSMSCNDFLDGCAGGCYPVGIESRYYLHKSAPWTLSIFQVEKFIGNFRKNSHARGTVEYQFLNFNLKTGKQLLLREIFPDPKKSVPLFWKYLNNVLKEKGAPCAAQSLSLASKRLGGGELKPEDILLSKNGATIALFTQNPSKCQSEVVDIPRQDLIGMGAEPDLWAEGRAAE